jgi:hypothetical protein
MYEYVFYSGESLDIDLPSSEHTDQRSKRNNDGVFFMFLNAVYQWSQHYHTEFTT